MNKNNNKKIYNIGNMNEEIKMIDVAKKIKLLIGKSLKLKKGKVTEGSPIRRIPNMSKTLKKIRKKNFVSFDVGLQRTLNWYKIQIN